MAIKNNMSKSNIFSYIMLNFPSLSLFNYDVSRGGLWVVLQFLIFADMGEGVGVQKGTKCADIIVEQPLMGKYKYYLNLRL